MNMPKRKVISLLITQALCLSPYITYAATNAYGDTIANTAITSSNEVGGNYSYTRNNSYMSSDASPYLLSSSGPYSFYFPYIGTTYSNLNLFGSQIAANAPSAYEIMFDASGIPAGYDGAVAYLEGNYADQVQITSTGTGGYFILYKNYAAGATLTNTAGSTLILDANYADGATLNNDNATMYVLNNQANNANISNTGAGTMYIDNNFADGANITNDASTMYIFNNSANNATLVNQNNATMYIEGNTASGSSITNGSAAGDNSELYSRYNTAAGITFNNLSGTLYAYGSDFSGFTAMNNAGATMNIGDCTTDNGCAESRTSVITDSTVNNAGILNLAGMIDFTNSTLTNQVGGITNVSDLMATGGTVDNAGTLNVLSSSTISTTTNSGIISLDQDSSNVGTVLTIDGDYTGNNGTLALRTVLGDDSSVTDKLVITGAASGQTAVSVTNAGGSGDSTVEGIEVISTGSSSSDTFTQSGRIVAGAYEYHLQQGTASGASTNNWYLTSYTETTTTPETPTTTPETPTTTPETPTTTPETPTTTPETPTTTPETPTTTPETTPETPATSGERAYRPETGSYASNLLAANTLFLTTLHDRLGETQYTDALTGEQKVTSLWMRNIGGHQKSKMADGQNKTQSNRYVVQMGGDLAQWSTDGLDRYHLGVMAGYANQKSRTTSSLMGYSSRGQINGYSAGVYGTWYANDEDKSGLYVDSWLQYSWFNNEVKGDELGSESYKSRGFTASLETGYAFKLGETKTHTGMTNSFWLQPQAQVMWMGVKANSHTENNGTVVQGTGQDNIRTRLGMKAYMLGHSALDEGKDRNFQPYVEANWIHNTKDFGVTMDGEKDYMSGTRNIAEVKAGVEGQLNKQLNLWGNVAQQIGDKSYSDTQVMIGVKYQF